MRRIFVVKDGEVVQLSGETLPVTPRIQIIQDSLPPGGLKHPCTGEYIDSKSKFRKITKAFGCVEVGDAPQKDSRNWDLGSAAKDIAQVWK